MTGHRLCRAAGGLAMGICFALIGCSSGKLEGILGKDTIAILTNAEEVETYRLDSKSFYPDKRDSEGARIDGFLVISKGNTQGSAFAAKLRAILLRGSTYGEVGAKCFEPGVAYRFKHGDKSVDVLICFMCNDLDVQPNQKRGSGTEIQLADFPKDVRAALLALTKEAFADDPEIQAIADK